MIDYEIDRRIYSAILIRDSDGLYHVAFFNPFGVAETVGTKYAKAVRPTANERWRRSRSATARPIYGGRCSGASASAARTRRRSASSSRTTRSPSSSKRFPDAEFKASGGNADYAFYTLATPATHWTLVFAREADEGPASPPSWTSRRTRPTYAATSAPS